MRQCSILIVKLVLEEKLSEQMLKSIVKLMFNIISSIEFNLINKNNNDFQKISRFELFRKFLSKNLRNILRKN